MARRRKSKDAALFEGLMALSAFVVLGWIFSPQLRQLIIFFGLILVLAFVIWVCYRIVNSETLFGEEPLSKLEPEFQASQLSVSSKPTLSEQLHKMDWFQFEKLVSKVYETCGYSVKRLGGAQPDGGVDLIIEKEGLSTVVQCKQWRKWKVGVRQIREFLGTLTDSKIQCGIFITLSGYTADAAEFANKHRIKILVESDIIGMLTDSGLAFSPEISELLNDRRKFCPKCESEMVLRTASRGNNLGSKFWGCSNYPRCRFIFQIAE